MSAAEEALRAELRDLIERLVALPGPSGFEDPVAMAIHRDVAGLGGELSTDPLGNVALRFPPLDGPSLLLIAHMDEVGLLVKFVDENGMLHPEANGLIDERALLASEVDVWTTHGPQSGVIGVKSRHLLTEEESRTPVTIADLWIDVGATSRDEANAMGIEIGLPITYRGAPTWLTDDVFVSKAIDDRAGCAVLMSLAKELADRSRDFGLTFVWSTQEEVGARGARVAAAALRPTVAVVLDTMPANDPATPMHRAASVMGGGPAIRAQDARGFDGTLYSVAVKRALIAAADLAGIRYQLDVFPTWTDASGVHLSGGGVATGGVYMPRRNSHSPRETIDLRDVVATRGLLATFIQAQNAASLTQLAARPRADWV